MERLTTEERVIMWPDSRWPQEIGALVVLDGRALLDDEGRVRTDRVAAVIASRLDRVPRLRQVVHYPHRGLGPPIWLDATDFRITDHLHVRPLPAPGDETALLGAVQEIMRTRLDRARPLWEMWFLPGMSGDRIGLFIRLHHVIADGIASVATLGVFLDESPDVPIVDCSGSPTWQPSPAPGALELLRDTAARGWAAMTRMLAALRKPVETVRIARGTVGAMVAMLRSESTPTTSLDHPVGAGRMLLGLSTDLDGLRRVARSRGATVNDAFLTGVAGGLARLLRARGDEVGGIDLPVYVPITLRHGDRSQARGNDVGQMVVALPLGPMDGNARLDRIRDATTRAKAEPHPSLGLLLHGALARRLLLRVLAREPISVATANVPGPPRPLYLAGSQVLAVMPVLALIGNVTIGVGSLSYAGRFGVLAIGDADSCPDLEVFFTGMADAWRDLGCDSTAFAPTGRTAASGRAALAPTPL